MHPVQYGTPQVQFCQMAQECRALAPVRLQACARSWLFGAELGRTLQWQPGCALTRAGSQYVCSMLLDAAYELLALCRRSQRCCRAALQRQRPSASHAPQPGADHLPKPRLGSTGFRIAGYGFVGASGASLLHSVTVTSILGSPASRRSQRLTTTWRCLRPQSADQDIPSTLIKAARGRCCQ